MSSDANLDRFGMFASSACALHCVLCALAPGILSALGAGQLLGHEAEWAFTIVAVGIAAVAFGFSYRKHQSLKVGLILAIGGGALLMSRLLEEFMGHGGPIDGHTLGMLLGVIGGGTLLYGHYRNIKAVRCCPSGC